MSTHISTINLGDRSYDIYIGGGLIYRATDFVPYDLAGRPIFIVTDTNVQAIAKNIEGNLSASGVELIQTLVLPAGESTKSFDNYIKLTEWLLQHKVRRNAVLFAVGGGVIGDLAGFAAATVLRGIDFIQVPTTLLAQVDSSVGGKTGINTSYGKNLVGAFYQPKAVIADIDALKTLPRRQLLAGYAEIVKYGLINNEPFFTWLEANGRAVCDLETEALTHAIATSVEAKATIVQADETEQGARALLNLGHTFGHALEAAARYDGRLLHGEAVAIGTVLAFDLSARLGLCAAQDGERIEAHFASMGLPTRIAQITPSLATTADKLIDLMGNDKKADAHTIKFILASGIGHAMPHSNVPRDILHDVIKDSLLSETKGIKDRWKSAFLSRV